MLQFLSEAWTLIWVIFAFFFVLGWEFLKVHPGLSIVFFICLLVFLLWKLVRSQWREPTPQMRDDPYYWWSLLCVSWNIFLIYAIGPAGSFKLTSRADRLTMLMLVAFGIGLVLAFGLKGRGQSNRSGPFHD